MSEKISVIIPVYNGADKIQRCLDSVFSQTYQNLEVIVVDDGSTDDLLLALTNCQRRLTIIHQENKGAPAARNYGFKVSTGELVIFLDADITMAPRMLEKLVLALRADPEADFSYCRFKFGWKTFRLRPFDRGKLKQLPCIHTSALIRRNAFPGFDESLKKFQDWDLFLTIAEVGGRGVLVPEVLFRVESGGTMSSWLPKYAYKLRWLRLPSKRKYETAMAVIKKKHHL